MSNKPVSVFLVARSLEVGGAERQLVVLAKGLRERGHTVTIGLFYRRGALLALLEGSGVEVVDLGKAGRWDLPGFWARTVAAARRARPDVIYGILGGGNLVASAVRPFVPNARLVWSVRGSNARLNTYDWLQRLCYRVECKVANFPELIIANSFAGVNYSVLHGFPADKFIVIPNGIDTDRFKPDLQLRVKERQFLGLRDDEVAVGMLARFDPVKGHPSFLRAAQIALKTAPNLRFLCIGGGSEHERLELLAHELGLEDRIIIAGERDAVAALNAFDVACSCSLSEGFSNSIAEAMACGLPCIATDVGDSALIVGSAGVIVPPNSPEELAHAMLAQVASLDQHDPRKPRMRIVEHFSISAMLDRTLDAFQNRLGIGPSDEPSRSSSGAFQ